MQIQDIAKLIGLQGVRVTKITCDETKGITEIEIEPMVYKRMCPCCRSKNVRHHGKPGRRQIKHVKIAVTQCVLLALRVRLKCKDCEATHTVEYEFVSGKERYTAAYKAQIYEMAIGSTVAHTAEVSETPYSTAERFFKEAALRIAVYTKEHVQKVAQESAKLILVIDDFAIRKGHNYNTGIHDMRGESLLCVIEGRTTEELDEFMVKNPQLAALTPYAVVMDLAQQYHTFAAKYYPGAIRVADRFHANSYIIDALNEIRRRVSKELSPKDRADLKRNKHLLNKRNDDLTETQRAKLKLLLSHSNDLKAAYDLKEQLIDWYDCSFNYESAKTGFQRWIARGHALNIPEINTALKTFVNWQTEIVNYHRCRFTNGIVEGRNGKIKSLQRRRFFLRNRTFYESLILIECNREVARDIFVSLFKPKPFAV